MKSIQYFAKRAFFYFVLALVGLGLICIYIYGLHIYQTNKTSLEQTGYQIKLQTSAALRSTKNNILIGQAILLQEIKKNAINTKVAGEVIASTINYNSSCYGMWFAFDKKYAQKMPGKPTGEVFSVFRKERNYLLGARDPIKAALQPFDFNNFEVHEYKYDSYYKDPKFHWYQDPLKRKDETVYIKAYLDETASNKWMISFAKTVFNEVDELVGVIGVDYTIKVIKESYKLYLSHFGLVLVQAQDGKILLDIPTETSRREKSETHITGNISTYLGSLKNLEEYSLDKDLRYIKLKDKWVVLKVYKTIGENWYLLIYDEAWNFYKAILPFFFGLTFLIISFLIGFIVFLQKYRHDLLSPIDELLSWLKRDTLIIGSNKSFSGHYSESNILEINELVSCINTLFEVVNENFRNYRIELEKNLKTREDLEHLVQIRSEQLIEREKLAALGFMSAGLAHEIKNPLNLICNAAEIINLQMSKIEKAGIDLGDSAAKALSRVKESNFIILNNGQRVDNIVKTLLLQVRSNKDGHEHLVDLGDLIKTNLDFVLANYRPKLNNRIEIHLDIPDSKVILRANPVDLGRVFINILDNSCYAMIKKVNNDSNFNADLKIHLGTNDQGVLVKITDNGTGISKNDLSQIFTPFYTTKPPGEGTGLGLNFVYEIIKQLDGKVEINSRINDYTEISMFIPYKGKS